MPEEQEQKLQPQQQDQQPVREWEMTPRPQSDDEKYRRSGSQDKLTK